MNTSEQRSDSQESTWREALKIYDYWKGKPLNEILPLLIGNYVIYSRPTPQQQPDTTLDNPNLEQLIKAMFPAHNYGTSNKQKVANATSTAGQPDELSKAQARIRELDRMLEQFVYYGTIHTVRGVVPADFNSHEGLITLAKNYLQNK